MKILLRIDANDKNLFSKIKSILDTNNISYEELQYVRLKETVGAETTILAYVITLSLPHIIPALKYITPIIRSYIQIHKHHPIEIHHGKKIIKVSRPEDLDPAVSAIKTLSKLKEEQKYNKPKASRK